MFNLILSTFLFTFALTSALAVPDYEVITHKLVPMNLCVKMCVDVSYGGYCKSLCGSPGLCYPLTEPLAGEVSSLSLAQDVNSCSVFASPNCQSSTQGGSIIDVKGEVPWIGDAMNDQVRSYYCY